MIELLFYHQFKDRKDFIPSFTSQLCFFFAFNKIPVCFTFICSYIYIYKMWRQNTCISSVISASRHFMFTSIYGLVTRLGLNPFHVHSVFFWRSKCCDFYFLFLSYYLCVIFLFSSHNFRLWDDRRWNDWTSDGNQGRAREAPRQSRTERTIGYLVAFSSLWYFCSFPTLFKSVIQRFSFLSALHT